jgi:hypothetical protein
MGKSIAKRAARRSHLAGTAVNFDLWMTCKSKDIIIVKGESWNSVMTTPNSPNSKPAQRNSNDDAYLLGELIGGVVEEIDT